MSKNIKLKRAHFKIGLDYWVNKSSKDIKTSYIIGIAGIFPELLELTEFVGYERVFVLYVCFRIYGT